MARYAAASLAMVGHVTQRSLPTRMSLTTSSPRGDLAAMRRAAAEATTYTMPMIASCGTRPRPRLRVAAKRAAPITVNASAKSCAVARVGRHADQEAGRRAEGRHLRQREVHEDHLAGDHVQAEVRVDRDQDHAGHERRQHQLDHRVPGAAAKAWARPFTQVFIRSK